MIPTPATASSRSRPLLTCLVVGPAEHGVTAEALRQHAALDADAAGPVRLVRHPGAGKRSGMPAGPLAPALTPDLLTDLGEEPGPVVLHVTDRLLGRSPADAADVVVALAAVHPLVVVLHDLPQPSDGRVNHPRRADAYRRMAQAAALVVVASRHEQRLLAACGVGPTVRCALVPLPLPDLGPLPPLPEPAAPGSAAPGAPAPRGLPPLGAVAVLGYLYPGKGHDDVLAALDVLPPGVGLLAWGRPSDGHEDLVATLTEKARGLGRTCEVSGYLPTPTLAGLLRSGVVPVAPHQHLSASGSVNAWLAAGRCPLVPRSDYADELLERRPGCVLPYDDLRSALAAAWVDPASTWALDDGAAGPAGSMAGPIAGPTTAQTAALLREALVAAGLAVAA